MSARLRITRRISHPVVDPVDLAQRLERAVNDHRRSSRLRILEHDPTLAAACRQHVQRMRNLGFFDHIDPYDGTSPGHRVRAVGDLSCMAIAENLAAGQVAAEEVLLAWLTSPGHRANLERREFTHVGTCATLGGPLRTYVAQLYAADAQPLVVAGPLLLVIRKVGRALRIEGRQMSYLIGAKRPL